MNVLLDEHLTAFEHEDGLVPEAVARLCADGDGAGGHNVALRHRVSFGLRFVGES